MKKQLLSWLMAFTIIINVASAQRGRGKENIEAMKVGYITRKLDLSAEEAQKFWPVYNNYTDELEKQRKNFRGKMMEEMSSMDDMSDAQADKTLNEMIAFRLAEVEVTKKYIAEFKKVIPVKKVVMLYKAEQEFKRDLLMKLKERQGRN
ncbi:MAG: hypothetical protein H7296_04410 [Bacteroidia bacterium]|nr:hypothetical protein [Bacteroidia bacterium]